MSPNEQDRISESVAKYTAAFQRFDIGEMITITMAATDAERRVLDELRRDLREIRIPYTPSFCERSYR